MTSTNSPININSAERISRDLVEALVGGPEVDLRGRVPLELVEREYGPDPVVGRVDIREKFRVLYAEKTGVQIGEERARQLLKDYVFDTWRSVPIITDKKGRRIQITITRQSSLEARVADAVQARADGIRERTSGALRVKWR